VFPTPSTQQPARHSELAEPGPDEPSLDSTRHNGSRGASPLGALHADGVRFLSRSNERDEAIDAGSFDEGETRGDEERVESWLHLSLGFETG